MAISRICSIPDCSKPAVARGWCDLHYRRFKRNGEPTKTTRAPDGEPLRYITEVVLPYNGDDCLRWPYSINDAGYGKLWYGGRLRIVPNLVCELTHGPAPSPNHETRHLCGNGHNRCCAPRHLVWGTHSENMADCITHGTDRRGAKHPLAKLSEADILSIRAMSADGDTQRAIAARFGIGQMQVSRILSGIRWGHLS